MSISLPTDNCCGCSACENICPQKCINLTENKDGFYYPQIMKADCINCGLCAETCPVNAVDNKNKTQKQSDIVAYAAYADDDKLRSKSTSGGIFSLLAEQIIKSDGVVFGAAFSSDRKSVRHIAATNNEELSALRASKYLQSLIGNAYTEAKQYLSTGKKVLFSGTPCQIAGLKRFLHKDYDKLLCVDIICHGVPSPKAWKAYIKDCEKKYQKNIKDACFVDKSSGWHNRSIAINFGDDSVYKKLQKDNPYMKAFINDICLRNSCSDCRFKSSNRDSDITLGDFWGVGNFCPQMDDNKGTSLVILNTQKGKDALEGIKADISCRQIDFIDAVSGNPAYSQSYPANPHRKEFFDGLDSTGFDNLLKHYIRQPNVIVKSCNKLKRLISKRF